jgi:hypothetical protein
MIVMAERRMFAKTIIDSDAFLDMPLSTQCLYFHLSMRADDDGFLNNAKKIQRTVGANDDDYKILLSKNFVIPLDDGVCVIKHWLIHNYIQKDRYKETIYTEHKNKLSIKNNNVYTLDTECIQDVSSLEAQVRLGKVSLVKIRSTYEQDFETFWINYPKKKNKGTALKAWVKLKPRIDDVLFALSWQRESSDWLKMDGQYIPHPASYLNAQGWKDEMPKNNGVPF